MTQSLAALVEATCGVLDRLPVRITGAWQPCTRASGAWMRHAWHGVACAAEPMVALLCVRTGAEVAWHKSSHSVAPSGTPASTHELQIRLGLTVAPDEPLAGLDLHVQGAYASLAARNPPAVLAARTPVLDVPPERATTTGVVIDLACVPAKPEVVFSLLVIPRAQVKMGRNHLWHVRPALAPALGEPLRTILSRGRRGTLALDTLHVQPEGANIEPP